MKKQEFAKILDKLKREFAIIGYRILNKDKYIRNESISEEYLDDLRRMGMDVVNTNYKIPYSKYKRIFTKNNYISIDKYLHDDFIIDLFDDDISILESAVMQYQNHEKPWNFKFKVIYTEDRKIKQLIYDTEKVININLNNPYTILKVDKDHTDELSLVPIEDLSPTNVSQDLYVIVFHNLLNTSDTNYTHLSGILGGDVNTVLSNNHIDQHHLIFVGNENYYDKISIMVNENTPGIENDLINISNYVNKYNNVGMQIELSNVQFIYKIYYNNKYIYNLNLSPINDLNFGVLNLKGGLSGRYHHINEEVTEDRGYDIREIKSKLDEVLAKSNPEFIFFLNSDTYRDLLMGQEGGIRNILKDYFDMNEYLKSGAPNMLVIYKNGNYHYFPFDDIKKTINYNDI